jgi:hypothetical protein
VIAFFCKNQKHFVDHAFPIYRALPPELRGVFYARGRAAARCTELGIEPVWPPPRWSQRDTVLIASYEDYKSVRPARVIFLNHGVGQTYILANGQQNHPAYSGGSDRERTILFLEPSERAANISRAAYPDIPSVAIGVPYLDRYLTTTTLYDPQLIAISAHTDVTIVNETRSAFNHYRKAITEIARSGKFKLLGHCHPRMHSQMKLFWEGLGVEFEPSWLRVLDRAGIYVVDTSSTGYEFAATNRPVIWLNQPSYRRNVHHGLRFWDLIPGVQVDDPIALELVLEQTIRRPDAGQQAHRRIIEQVYDGGVLDGHAVDRAVEAIQQATYRTGL